MSTITTGTQRRGSAVGSLLRHWRTIRRLSQLELSLRADVSQRHLSWVETGRSRPSRELLLHLAAVLDVPLRDRNAMLQAGGFAAVYPQRRWDDPDMGPAREAIELLLRRHEPYPAIVLDGHWALVDANEAAVGLITTMGGPQALAVADGNAMRLLVHPDGLRRSIVNWDEVGGHLADRITREAASYPDDTVMQDVASEMLDLIGPVPRTAPDAAVPLVVESRMRSGGLEVATMSMLASVGGALDVTLSELLVELFYPAGPTSAATLEALASG